ncbi:MAG: hypothetical protein M1839_000477 [Geoglossum umbratile]|nr:MAG: hypothetical protein M1839_000477 [Geoglossum umbratile]
MLPQEQSPLTSPASKSGDSPFQLPVFQTQDSQATLETLEYYYDFIDSDEAVYWALKDEFKDNLQYPRTYLVRLKQVLPPTNHPLSGGLTEALCRPTRKAMGFACLEPSCDSLFTRKADLERHVATMHAPRAARFDCPLARCHRKGEDGFTREDHLNEHLRNYHNRDIPKRGARGW